MPGTRPAPDPWMGRDPFDPLRGTLAFCGRQDAAPEETAAGSVYGGSVVACAVWRANWVR